MSTIPSKAAAEIAERNVQIALNEHPFTYSHCNSKLVEFLKTAIHQSAQEAIAWRPEVSEDMRDIIERLLRDGCSVIESEYGNRVMDPPYDVAVKVCEVFSAGSADSAKRIAELEAENKRLTEAIITEQSGLAAALESVQKTASGYQWITEGRGLYPYDDNQYKQEAGYMIEQIGKICSAALRKAGLDASKALHFKAPKDEHAYKVQIADLEEEIEQIRNSDPQEVIDDEDLAVRVKRVKIKYGFGRVASYAAECAYMDAHEFYTQQLTKQAAEDFTNIIAIKALEEECAAKDKAITQARAIIDEREAESLSMPIWIATNMIWRNANGEWFNKYNEAIDTDATINDVFRKETEAKGFGTGIAEDHFLFVEWISRNGYTKYSSDGNRLDVWMSDEGQYAYKVADTAAQLYDLFRKETGR